MSRWLCPNLRAGCFGPWGQWEHFWSGKFLSLGSTCISGPGATFCTPKQPYHCYCRPELYVDEQSFDAGSFSNCAAEISSKLAIQAHCYANRRSGKRAQRCLGLGMGSQRANFDVERLRWHYEDVEAEHYERRMDAICRPRNRY